MTEGDRPRDFGQNYLVFGSGAQICGLPLSSVREIVHLSALERPPGAPSFFAGFLNLSGQQIAILRLAALYSLPAPEDQLYTPILLLKETPWGLLLDEVLGLELVAPEALNECPREKTLNGFVSAMFEAKGQAVYVLDLEKLLLKEEKERLKELNEQAEQRVRRCQGSK